MVQGLRGSRRRFRAIFAATLLSGSATVFVGAPPGMLPLVDTPDGAYHFDPASVRHGDDRRVQIMVYGSREDTTQVQTWYELICPGHAFRQLSLVEERNGAVSRCSTPSEPIDLKPEKHLVPAALFQRFCP